jgi:hypothetical protein
MSSPMLGIYNLSETLAFRCVEKYLIFLSEDSSPPKIAGFSTSKTIQNDSLGDFMDRHYLKFAEWNCPKIYFLP